MKRSIPSIPQLYRNVRRWTEIVSVLSKYGLADWLSRFNLDFVKDALRAPDGEALARLTQSARIRLALTELGPTFIKFGQLLSTRPDLIGPDLADELSLLQDGTPADDFKYVKELIEAEQGRPLEEVFSWVDETPIASASIGQVHRATLRPEMADQLLDSNRESWFDFDVPGFDWFDKDDPDWPVETTTQNGQSPSNANLDVVIKVRHAGIEKTIETDLDILSGLAMLADRLEDLRAYQPSQIVREMGRIMRRELDFGREHRNLLQFISMFSGDNTVTIPRPVSSLCSPRMITMQRLEGTKIGDLRNHASEEFDLTKIARSGANLYLKMIFLHGFYHADPHPGNLLICEHGKIGLLDFGMVGRISESLREDIESMLVSIVNRDVQMLVALIKRVGKCPIELDDAHFDGDIADFVGQYSTQVLSQFDMSGAFRDFLSIVRRFNITLPSEVSLLIKVLVSLEGTGRKLDPEFSLMEIMKPFQRMMILKRMSPARHIRKMRRFYMQVEQLVDILPTRINNILEQVQSGRFDIHLDHRRLGPTANRLVMGLMSSALFLGSSWMMSSQVPPLMFPGKGWMGIQNLSMLGLMGCLVSIMMGLRLMWAIRKSGNLDQPE